MSKNERYYFETTPANFAWSDVRADAAAAQELRDRANINQEDWSDLKVRPLQEHVFRSKQGSPDATKFVFKVIVEKGNHKHYHP